MTYYAFIENNKIQSKGQCPCLSEGVQNVEVTEDVYNNLVRYMWDGEAIVPNPNYPEEQAAREKQRIQTLSMTRSDFFDNTIKAWGANSEDLLPVVKRILGTLEISDIEKKIAINNYENALNFYRKHALFTLLSGVPITIGNKTIIVTEDQWDSFFDKVDKRDPEAYRELLPDLQS